MTEPLHRSNETDADRHLLAWASWPADLATPVGLFLSLRSAGRRPCLLESVDGPSRLTRYSFLGIDPVAQFRASVDASRLHTDGGTEILPGRAHEALREAARRFSAPPPPAGCPPFRGGWVGWFSYEWAASLEPTVPIGANDPWGVPQATFDFYRDVVALDHASSRIVVFASAPDGRSDYQAAQARVDGIYEDMTTAPDESGRFNLVGEFRPNMGPAEFEAGVVSLQGAIRQGEIYQAVLSQRFDQRFVGDPFTLYRVVRLTNPAPHMFYFTADDVTLIGSSPERLVSVREGRVQNVPIAGTRPRSDDEHEDDRLGAELVADPKERAEHDMLVDLARNDLGRVARAGSVRVSEYASLEKFARVQHLVSRVECELAEGKGSIDALAASFPAGTVSGAPKIRAMQLLAALEQDRRGPYAGAFGYLDASGAMDMAITIRTLAVHGDVVSFQAGAGIVHDSVPEREYEETLHKGSALFEAVRLAESPAFAPSPLGEEARA